jgi:PucR-like helix-turn-helix protein
MGVGTTGDNEWIEKLTPELRPNAPADLRAAMGAAAPRELYVHRNTVAYRLTQAEELLGHPIADRELELRVALETAATLGDAVLAGADR